MKKRLDGSYSWAARQVWEKYFGAIPKGFHIHHIDQNKENNNPSNLLILTPTEHRRKHCPVFESKDGIWWKTCTKCGKTKLLESFPLFRNKNRTTKTTRAECKSCYYRVPHTDWTCQCCGHKWKGKLLRPNHCPNCSKIYWWLPKEERHLYVAVYRQRKTPRRIKRH